jgi:hypothetical protein
MARYLMYVPNFQDLVVTPEIVFPSFLLWCAGAFIAFPHARSFSEMILIR